MVNLRLFEVLDCKTEIKTPKQPHFQRLSSSRQKLFSIAFGGKKRDPGNEVRLQNSFAKNFETVRPVKFD